MGFNIAHGRMAFVLLAGSSLTSSFVSAVPYNGAGAGSDDPFAVLDQQHIVLPDNMTWADYVKPPGTTWSDPSRKGSERNFNIALVVVDYPDQPFVVTLEPGSTPFGNPLPVVSGLSRDEVPSFYHDYLNVPSDLNHRHTLHEYWMEDSGGRYGTANFLCFSSLPLCVYFSATCVIYN